MFGGIVAFVALVIMLIYLVNKFIHDKTICLLLALLFGSIIVKVRKQKVGVKVKLLLLLCSFLFFF